MVTKKDINFRLKTIKQAEFLVTYYSLFILLSANTDPEKFNVKDKEELKDILFNISRRRSEIERCTEMYSNFKATAEDKAALVEQVRRNTKVIWHLKVRIMS